MLTITNEDCMDMMARYPDRHFDLAVVDPPYGGGHRLVRDSAANIRVNRTGGGWGAKHGNKIEGWDMPPAQEYFSELFRVSKNQIIWGGNYFNLPPTRGFIVWDKFVGEGFTMAMCEDAWTSFNRNAKKVAVCPIGTARDPHIHPTQKPVKLYKWLLGNYAEPGQSILDTHMGSGSIAIACHDLGFDLTACELDADYFNAAMERIEAHNKQGTLFDNKELTAANF
jgi:site-specific DNA-methyltransferase (adenine-specific)